MNDDEVQFRQPSKFVEEIVEWVDSGGGIVPLIGAGVSVSAGIPVIPVLKTYLQDCVVRSVASLCKDDSRWNKQPWNPHHDPWPNLHLTAAEAAERDRRCNQFRAYCRARIPKGKEDAISEARGAMWDWRTCLLFLSRLERCGSEPTLGAAKNWIIDGLVRHVVANHNPALEHRMFALLGNLLRVRVSLTTNFDDLYERAFAEQGTPLTVFDVHLNAGLPAGDIVHSAGPVLVKVHGGRYGFRADYSLDEPPGADERRTFTSYVAGTPLPPDEWEYLLSPAEDAWLKKALEAFNQDTSIPRALLVCGVGGNDERILRLLASVIRPLSLRARLLGRPAPRIFWVAYAWRDVEVVTDQMERYPDLRGVVTVTQERYLGLMLLELYQRLTGAVPPSAVEFPSMWRISTPPDPYGANDDWRRTGAVPGAPPRNPGVTAQADFSEAARRVCKQIASMSKTSDSKHDTPRLLLVTSNSSDRRTCDVVTLAAYVFHKELEMFKSCIWIELDQVANADELFERILQAMGKLTGEERRMVTRATDYPVVQGGRLPEVGPAQRIADRQLEFWQMTNGRATDWRIFLHGAEGLGTSVHLDPFRNPRSTRKSGWDYRAKKDLLDLIGVIAGTDTSGRGPSVAGATVILTLDKEGKAADLVKMVHKQFRKGFRTVAHEHFGIKAASTDEVVNYGFPGVSAGSDRGLKSLNRPAHEDLKRFVYIQTFSETPRYPAGLVLWPFRTDDDLSRFEKAPGQAPDWSHGWLKTGLRFVEEMYRFGWARRKSGGFVWMHNAVKDRLRQQIGRDLAKERGNQAARLEIDIHQSMADWYWRLFVSSGNPPSLFESVRHRLCCARSAMAAASAAAAEDKPPYEWVSGDARGRALSSLLEAAMSLRLGRPVLLSRGYTPGSCDRLERIAKALDRFVPTVLPKQGARSAPEVAESLEVAAGDAAYHARYNLFRLALEVVDARKIPERFKAYNNRSAKQWLTPQTLPWADKDSVERQLDGVLADIHCRHYAAANQKLVIALGLLKKASGYNWLPFLQDFAADPVPGDASVIVCSVFKARERGGAGGAALYRNNGAVELAVRVYRLAMDLELQRGEAEHVARTYVPEDGGPRYGNDHSLVLRIKRAGLMYHFASELTRFLPADRQYRLLRERIALKQTYAAVLSIAGEHTEAGQRFSEACSLAGFNGGRMRDQFDGITGILRAEATLRRIYQHPENTGFAGRFKYLTLLWLNHDRGDNSLPIREEERNRILAWIWDTDAILDGVGQRSTEQRKDAWWTSRYFFARIRAEAFRCIALAGSGQHERLMESRGDGRPSGLLVMAEFLQQMARIMRTDTFIVARGYHQAFMALEAVKLWHGTAMLQAPAMPDHLRRRLDIEIKLLDDRLGQVIKAVTSVQSVFPRSGKVRDSDPPAVGVSGPAAEYVWWAIDRLDHSSSA